MGAERTFPREDKRNLKKGVAPPPCAVYPALCVAVIGARYPVKSGGKRGRGAVPLVYTGVVLSLVSEGGKKDKSFFTLTPF